MIHATAERMNTVNATAMALDTERQPLWVFGFFTRLGTLRYRFGLAVNGLDGLVTVS